MMFDHSRAPAAGSKWRQVTGGDLARADATDKRLRIETQALRAGVALPVSPRRSRAKSVSPGPAPSSKDEIAGLRALLSQHGREIAPLLVRAVGEDQQLRLARGFRDVLNGVPDAHERWIVLLRELDI